MIPIAKPMIGKQEIDIATSVLASGMLAGGPNVNAFQDAWSKHTQVPYTVIVRATGFSMSNGMRY